jgi:uncharacterized protein (DUF1330 family)
MKTLTPTREQIEELMKCPDEGKFVMINLLKFAGGKNKGSGAGQEAYGRYAKAVAPMLEKIGGRLLWMGSVNHVFIGMSEDKWDMVLLVEYPSRKAFIQMISTPEYLDAHKYREAALENSALLASSTVFIQDKDSMV